MWVHVLALTAVAGDFQYSCVHNPKAVLMAHPRLYRRGFRAERPDVTPANLPPRLSSEELPKRFDWRNVNGKSFVTRNLNQHIPQYCGSCWAHAASSSFSDRIKILRNATWPDIDISVQYALNCLTPAGTCNGGSDLLLYEQFHLNGVPDETCQSYVAEDQVCNDQDRCRNCFGPPGQGYCFAQKNYFLYQVKDFGFIENLAALDQESPDLREPSGVRERSNKAMVKAMKQEIFQRGPISCTVDADTMFDLGPNDILRTLGNETNHVVSVAGWDRDDQEQEFWIFRNSWGTYWADNGWGKVYTGSNYASIESFCSWATPAWPPKKLQN